MGLSSLSIGKDDGFFKPNQNRRIEIIRTRQQDVMHKTMRIGFIDFADARMIDLLIQTERQDQLGLRMIFDRMDGKP